MFIRNPYNYDRDAASLDAGFECKDESMAKQSFAEECDINTIVRRFGLTGQVPQDVRMPLNMDFDRVLDYKSCVDALIAADEAFMQFPAHIRERFQNDPQQMIDFLGDDKNRAEAERLKLVMPPLAAPVVAAGAAPAGGGAAAPGAAPAAPAAS